MIEPGNQAPDFTLPDQDGNPIKLYPKADVPGSIANDRALV